MLVFVSTVVSLASAHSRVSAHAHVPHLRGQCSSFYTIKHMEIMSQVSAHVGPNRDVCLSTHGRLPGTLRYIHRLRTSLRRPLPVNTGRVRTDGWTKIAKRLQ